MINVGIVQGTSIDKARHGTKQVRYLQVKIFNGNVQTMQYAPQTGEDTNPPNGSLAVFIDVGGAKIVIATFDFNVPAVDPGEKKLYALTSDGNHTPLGFVYLKKDGSVVVEATDGSGNAKGKIELKPDGSATVTATKITLTGGELDVAGTGTPPQTTGPFCALPSCLFTGAPHLAAKVMGT